MATRVKFDPVTGEKYTIEVESTSKASPKEKLKKEKQVRCFLCNRDLNGEKFYRSNSVLMAFHTDAGNVPRTLLCKTCCDDLYNLLVDKYDDPRISAYLFCQLLDIYYNADVFETAIKNSVADRTSLIGNYMSIVNALPQYRQLSFQDSPKTNYNPENLSSIFDETETIDKWTKEDKENRDEVVRLLHTDPFCDEQIEDRKSMYRDLLGILDEDMAADLVKSKAAIEIVRSFLRIDKIQKVLSELTSTAKSTQNNADQIKKLMATKAAENETVAKYCKDNGLNERYAINKARGSGTLSGIMKQMQEDNFWETFQNAYDAKTSDSICQAAEASSKAIFSQLALSENDYTIIIKEQREMVEKLTLERDKLAEENRLLKVKVKEQELQARLDREKAGGR